MEEKKFSEELDLEVDETQEEEAYVSYDIASYPSDFTLSGIFEKWNLKEIIIPDFQREYVWNIKQASLLMESFLLGLPVPPVFFYVDDKNLSLVIDGQQRILSTVFYFEGLFGSENLQGKRQVFRLQGLSEKSPFYKKTFQELEETYQRKLKGTVLRAINIRQLSPKGESTSVYHIFERLNTGGTPLRSQEIRNVVFIGDFISILRDLNRDRNWRLILGENKINKHHVDVELVLRLFAFRKGANKYEKPMKEFLNVAMSEHRTGQTSEVQHFRKYFPILNEIIIKALGVKPFHLRGKLNTSAMDCVFSILYQNIDALSENLKERYDLLKNDPKFMDYTTIGTTDTTTVKARFELAKKYLID
ncbi:MAG: DUF262 domain-containing protein [Saprospiraceae bacterium]|nr:DUF262 domain-containing protein [Saprospiraceae bacterium]